MKDNQRYFIWPEPKYPISDCRLEGKDGELLNNRWQTCHNTIRFCCSCCLEISWLGHWQQPVEFQAMECICHHITFASFESSVPHGPLPVTHPHCCSLLRACLGRPVLYLCPVSSGKMGYCSKWWQVEDLAGWEPEDIKLSWLSEHFKAKYKYIKMRGLLHEHASSLELVTTRLHHCTDKWVHSFQKVHHNRHTQ